MKKRKLSINEVKQIELELLIAFSSFCKEHNLICYLCGGTLLGAIRHKGFIPWDDDIDVFMPRNDYEKMQKLLQGDAINKYYELKALKGSKSTYPFCKLVDTRTEINEVYRKNHKTNQIWIDIFPVDNLPEQLSARKKIYIKSTIYKKMNLCAGMRIGKGASKTKAIIGTILYPLAKIMGEEYWAKRSEKIAQKCSELNSNYVGCIVWGYGIRECIKKEPFFMPIEVKFENHTFYAPSNYDEYLTNLYGDYMKLPPLKVRESKHEFEAYLNEEIV